MRCFLPILLFAFLTSVSVMAATTVVPATLLVGDDLTPANTAVVADGRLLMSSEFMQTALGYSVQVAADGTGVSIFGHRWHFKTGAPECKYDGATAKLDAAALVADQQVYLPATTVIGPMGGQVTKAADGRFHMELPGANIGSIRQGVHSDKVRMVVDLSAPTLFKCNFASGALILYIPVMPHPDGRNTMMRQLRFEDQLVPFLTEDRENGRARLTFQHQSRSKPLVTTLGEPARIVIDFIRPEPVNVPAAKPARLPEMPREAGPSPHSVNGVEWRLNHFGTQRGTVDAWSVRVNPRDAGISVRPALADGTVHSKRTVASIASARGAYAAINGGFFAPRGEPLGLVVIDSEWISHPLHNRAALGFLQDGSVQVRNAAFEGWANFDGLGRLPLEAINQEHVLDDGVVAYTPRWGDCLLGNPRKTRVVIESGIVTSVLSRGENALMPKNGFIVSGLDRRAASLAQVKVGQSASLDLNTKPKWVGLRHAIGGGPRLLAAGKIALNSYDEKFRSDVTSSIRPRTAVGVTADGSLLLIVVDSVNKGMTLTEVASIMHKLGAVDAMNLDGGGSTTLVIDGRVMNHPSDGTSRPVSNALVIIDRRKT